MTAPTIPQSSTWISDVPPSITAPAPRDVQVDLGGFAFTTGGICLPVTAADVADLLSSLVLPGMS